MFLVQKFKSLSALVVVVLVIILFCTQLNLSPWANAGKGKSLIRNDVVSYYGYLPATFIYKDLSLNFIDTASTDYRSKHQFWPKTAPNGNKVFKFTMGMSLMYSPFFFIAHTYSKFSNHYAENGFSKPYEIALALSCLFYLIFGLFFLRKTLLLFFSEFIASIVLIVLVVGTNLLYYSTSEPCMSHAYSFSLISIFIFLSIKWHQKQTIKKALVIGLVSGLIVLIRPVNLVILLFPFFLGVNSIATFRSNCRLFLKNWKQLLAMAIVAFLIVFPQLLYWKLTTDNWVYHSYVDEHFFFLNPHLSEFLMSYRKGWLVYTPIMVFALVGIAVSFKSNKRLFLPILMISLLNIYILSCWWCWWYGGSFGMRSMIDMYAFYGLALGVFLQWMIAQKNVLKGSLSIVIILLVCLNIFQTAQRRHLVIHWDSMTKQSYWTYFLTYKFDNQQNWIEQEKLLKHPDYQKALIGEDEYEFKVFD